MAYTAYGTPIGTPLPSTPFGWQGQAGCYTDAENGLVLMQARYYAPGLGRFVSRDPIGFAGGINLYAYCGGDPVNYWEPDGTTEFTKDYFKELLRKGIDTFLDIGPWQDVWGILESFHVPLYDKLGENKLLPIKDDEDAKDADTDFIIGTMGMGSFLSIDEAPASEADDPIAAADAANEEKLCPITGEPVHDNENERIDPPTDRTLLRRNMGEPPDEGYHAYHMLPWKFRKDFAKAGLDVNDSEYGLWVKAERHLSFSYKYNTEWTVFFIANKNASKDDILNKLLKLNNTGLYK